MGKEVTPDASVSIATKAAPNSKATMQAMIEAKVNLLPDVVFPISGRNTKGYAMRHEHTAILKMLHPNANKPPSAKSRHCRIRTELKVMKPAHGPNQADSNIPPIRCPLEPVPGIAKFIICTTKVKAPMTPIKGRRLVSDFTLRMAIHNKVVDITPITPATGGLTSASDMCIILSFFKLSVMPMRMIGLFFIKSIHGKQE